MPVAARVKPADFFTPEEWAPLAARSRSRGLWLVAHAWLVIVAAGALFVAFPNPLTLVVAVMLIGARQLGLAILMHDAAHGCLHPDLKVNDWVGQWLCGAPTNGELLRYRDYHLGHHKFAQQAEDPDLGLSAPFPITRQSLWRKAVRDLTGQTFYKQRIKPSLDAFRDGAKKGVPFRKTARGVYRFWRPFLIVNGIIILATSLIGLWWAWPVLWLLPMATWYPLITRLRNIAEHACVAKDEPDPLRHARTTRAGWLARAVLAPYYVNYHCEHHMFMHVPCWNLPATNRLLAAKGVTERMLTAPSYVAVLGMASSKAA
ncbi:fatty acid desaturase [Caulobacter ginsengisoli]|uniref:Fatty acid desaturase n=1 Tax=Caulobacter ginsengisoli TaxID=400775 RepID=A0ABU0J075_9CAUL|nr:fatty acid desaturase family protein [Caulobacter ginsengisoli]MDQ0466951.1 fatty acid desaturase [Caulobacter ginsengisoli]